jgi:hypothetical protein
MALLWICEDGASGQKFQFEKEYLPENSCALLSLVSPIGKIFSSGWNFRPGLPSIANVV